MRIFSSAENCRRVARRISFTSCSAGSFTGPDFCPIFAPSMATMGQKSPLPQLARSVSLVLMPDKDGPLRRGRITTVNAELLRPYGLALVAVALARVGDDSGVVAATEEGLSVATRTGVQWW